MPTPYYSKPKFKLYHGNCLNILAELPENSVDMVFADPPYLLSNGGFINLQTSFYFSVAYTLRKNYIKL